MPQSSSAPRLTRSEAASPLASRTRKTPHGRGCAERTGAREKTVRRTPQKPASQSSPDRRTNGPMRANGSP
eukprot:scaffold184530_cov22-Tisochrysis_lutea.AAC.2